MNLIQKIALILTLSFSAIQAKAESLALVLSFENYENGSDVRLVRRYAERVEDRRVQIEARRPRRRPRR